MPVGKFYFKNWNPRDDLIFPIPNLKESLNLGITGGAKTDFNQFLNWNHNFPSNKLIWLGLQTSWIVPWTWKLISIKLEVYSRFWLFRR